MEKLCRLYAEWLENHIDVKEINLFEIVPRKGNPKKGINRQVLVCFLLTTPVRHWEELKIQSRCVERRLSIYFFCLLWFAHELDAINAGHSLIISVKPSTYYY
jgi:hypothetical protein